MLCETYPVFVSSAPPSFNGLCMDKGIRFLLLHQEFESLWQPTIGLLPLTQELAESRGYSMTNSIHNMTLDVPLFTPGYIYEVWLQKLQIED